MGLPIERGLMPRVEIDAILVKCDNNNLLVKIDESAAPRWIPRSGVTVIDKKDECIHGSYVCLKLTENKAVAYGLV